MRIRHLIPAISVLWALVFAPARAATAPHSSTAILVDKKTNTLLLTEYVDGGYKVVKKYHATLGQVTGDKADDGDLKTPEGIYTFNSLLRPPRIQAKLGVMAFNMNFPNAYDDIAGVKGSGIMLHATNEPERLKKNYDSHGCVVVRNEEIQELKSSIRLGLTPILIFPELTDDYMKPGQDSALKTFFDGWVSSWEKKDIDGYISHYHSDFTAQGKNRAAWKTYKDQLNSRYSTIEIGPEDVRFYRHPKYSMITFTQNYRSKLKGGGWGHRSRGTKILYIAEEAGSPRIIAETYTTVMW
jgi:murein L,D-transpeptidase YafK